MSLRNPSSLGVGEVLFSSEFRITPHDVAAWERATILGGRDDRPGFRHSFEQPPVAGSPVPEGLILARALDAIEHSSGLGGCQIEQTSTGKLRTLARVSVGETLSSVATVRYRSERPEGTFLTLAIEIRGNGRKLAEVEVGVEVRAPTPSQPRRRAWAVYDQAA